MEGVLINASSSSFRFIVDVDGLPKGVVGINIIGTTCDRESNSPFLALDRSSESYSDKVQHSST